MLAAKVDAALESETFPPAVSQEQTGKGSRSAPEHDHQCPHDETTTRRSLLELTRQETAMNTESKKRKLFGVTSETTFIGCMSRPKSRPTGVCVLAIN